jgi:hypothetical protein
MCKLIGTQVGDNPLNLNRPAGFTRAGEQGEKQQAVRFPFLI